MFRYFQDPLNFSYVRDDNAPCHFCGSTESRLDGSHCRGEASIDAVCFACLRNGKLIDHDLTTNDVDLKRIGASIPDSEERENLTNQIIYCTPPLPTWQDTWWPFVDGDFCTFLKIASKRDFQNQNEFIATVYDEYKEMNDPDELWSFLPDREIRNLSDGQYNVSVYLFQRGNRLVTTWDAN
ncbi:CbrC family protein [Pirellulaceae bacterium SH449]